MTRSLVQVGTLAMLMFVPSSVFAGAKAPRVTVSRNASAVTVTIQSERLRATETATRTALTLDLAEGADRLRVTGALDGRVTITRGNRTHAFSMPTATAADVTAARELLGSSAAVRSFEQLLATEWGQSKAALPFAAAGRILRTLQGDGTAARAVVARMAGDQQPRLVRVQTTSPIYCWRQYESSLSQFTQEYNTCYEAAVDSLWNPLLLAFCAYRFDAQMALALLWLLDCHGY